jgi:predicted CopG family antitoxin
MQRQMTISVEEDVYNILAPLMAQKTLGEYISNLVHSRNKPQTLEEAYKAMAADTEREKEAQEWCNGYFGPADIHL